MIYHALLTGKTAQEREKMSILKSCSTIDIKTSVGNAGLISMVVLTKKMFLI